MTVGASLFGVLAVFILFVGVGLIVPIAIGVYVYRDASKRDMNATLWTVIVILTPGLIGLIIYLVARSDMSNSHCGSCGNRVSASFAICPYCGTGLRPTCANCGQAIEAGWIVCPNCGDRLPEGSLGIMHEPRSRDRGLSAILVGVIVVPILLIGVIAIVAASVFTGRVNVDTDVYLTPDDSIMIDEIYDSAIKMQVNVSEEIDNIYEAVIYLDSMGEIMMNECVSRDDGKHFYGESIYFAVEYLSESADSFYIEFIDEDGTVVYLSDLYAVDDYPESISLVLRDGEITEIIE